MALSCKVGSFSLNTATGNQAITGVGFQPKVVIFFSVIVTGDGLSVGGAAYKLYFGGAVSSSSRFSIGNVCNDNVSSGSHHSRQDNTKCMTSLVNAGTVFTAADFVSMDADGFTINVTTANASSRVWHYIAIGGTTLTNVAIKEFQNPGAAGAQAVTGVGFQGDCFLFFNTNNLTVPGQETVPELMIGAALADASQFVIPSNVSTPTNAASAYLTTRCVANLDTSNNVINDAIFSSADSDGFTLDWQDDTDADAYIWAICLKGGYYKIGQIGTKGSVGSGSVTGLGFQPTGLIVAGNNSNGDGVETGHSRISFGAASGSSAMAAIWAGKTDNTDPTVCDNSNQDDELFTTATEGTPTVNCEAELVSFGADSFTYNESTAAEDVLAYLAFGDTAHTTGEDELIAGIQTTINSAESSRMTHQLHYGMVGY